MNFEGTLNSLLEALQQQDEDAIATQARLMLSIDNLDWSRVPVEPLMMAIGAGLAEEECSALLWRTLTQPEYAGICDSHGDLIKQGLLSENISFVRLAMKIVALSLENGMAECMKSNGLLDSYLSLLDHEDLSISEECAKTIRKHHLEADLIPLKIDILRKALALLNGHLPEGWALAAELFRNRPNELDRAALINALEECIESKFDVEMAAEHGILQMLVEQLRANCLSEQIWGYFTRVAFLGNAEHLVAGIFALLHVQTSPAAYLAKGAWSYHDQSLMRPLVEDCFSHSQVGLGLAAAKGLCFAINKGVIPLSPHRLFTLAMEASKSSEDYCKNIAFELISSLMQHEEVVRESGDIVIPFLLDRESDESLPAAHWRYDILLSLCNKSWAPSTVGNWPQVQAYVQQGVMFKGAKQSRVMVAH